MNEWSFLIPRSWRSFCVQNSNSLKSNIFFFVISSEFYGMHRDVNICHRPLLRLLTQAVRGSRFTPSPLLCVICLHVGRVRRAWRYRAARAERGEHSSGDCHSKQTRRNDRDHIDENSEEYWRNTFVKKRAFCRFIVWRGPYSGVKSYLYVYEEFLVIVLVPRDKEIPPPKTGWAHGVRTRSCQANMTNLLGR